MDSANKSLKLPQFINTRDELESVMMERGKLEVELRDLEGQMMTFEESILKRGGPYFGRIAQGERAEKIIDEITKMAKNPSPPTKMRAIPRDMENSAEFDRPRRVRHSDRVFANSSVTSPSMVNHKIEPDTKMNGYATPNGDKDKKLY